MKPLLTVLLILTALTLLVSAPAFTQDNWQPLPEHEITLIAFGSCAKQREPQPIWNEVAAVEPDLFLFIGDAPVRICALCRVLWIPALAGMTEI